MKTATIIASVLAAASSITAVPTNNHHDKNNLDWLNWDNLFGNKGHHKNNGPFDFTSTYQVKAFGREVVNTNSVPTPGPDNAYGIFRYGINSHLNTICYNITLFNVRGDYFSMARTATHIHEGEKGKAGPARIVFPNPVGDDKRRNSFGCFSGPFTTGLTPNNGPDTGTGFHVRQIENNPRGFFTDSHTVEFPSGVVRGQLA